MAEERDQQEWRTAAGWAEEGKAGVPDIPASARGVKKKAEKDNWRSRPNEGQGGGLQYHVSSLPPAARLELARRAAQTHPPASVPASPAVAATKAKLKASSALTSRGKERLDAKLAICAAFDRFHQASGQGVFAARQKFVGFYNAGEITVEPYVRSEKPTISVSSLERWLKDRATGDAAKLAGRYGNRKGGGVLDRAVKDIKGYLIAALIENPNLSVEKVRRLLVVRFGEYVMLFDGAEAPMPSERRLQVIVQEWRDNNRQLHLAVTNPDAWKSRARVAVGNASEGIERPNQLWEIDASPSDVMLTDGRHSIYVVVDVFTRRIMVLVTKVPKSSAVLLLIRRAILAWGMPEAIKTDNGSDFTSREAERAYFLIGAAHPTCTPYSPEQKPHVERSIGTVQHSFMTMLPGYVGHDVAARQAIRARETFAKRLGEADADVFDVRLSAEELQQLVDAWVENVYQHNTHEGLGDRTPFEVAEAHAAGVARVADERQLDILLMQAPEGCTRTVGKKGVMVENATFYAHELIPFIGTGEELEVRLDPEDMGRIYCYRPDPFEFVCIAENPERLGLSRRALAAEAKALQQRFIADGKAAIKAAKAKFRPHELADAIIGKSLPAPAPKVTALPTAALPPTPQSAGMMAASRAVEAGTPAQAAPLTDAQQARQADIARRIEAPPVQSDRPEDRWWARAQAIEAAIAAEQEVTQDDLDWLAMAETTAWYRARKRSQERTAGFARAVE
ncbi:DDE-type integrase/transposase/recombinase [Roseomonas genomospecies 6]|uniref:Transposase n=1 Tax=Roseomonas genomospecies 6 TaxID=214106 RepID=A0A9W7KR64_9PROT|nr:DDE-type integrase/transposase/recombinase [Roseomonas genomospecies 6]KAA0678111.1 hypothetical protein DS843_21245 [Roseomonas genomospecies 6]